MIYSGANGYLSSIDWSAFNTGVSQWSASNGNIYRSSGNVRIGTTTPAQVLDVVGNIRVSGSIIQPAWTAVTYLNSWVDYGGTYAPVAYFKDKNNIVHLRGLAKNGTCGAAMFTLPAGYRPAYQTLLTTMTNSNVLGRLDIDTSGNALTQICNNGWMSLDGLTFLAEQ